MTIYIEKEGLHEYFDFKKQKSCSYINFILRECICLYTSNGAGR